MGGMTKAVESGMPKLRIEEAAARRQARIDRGEEVIVGVNKYRVNQGQETAVDLLDIDNPKVRAQQIARLEKIRAKRATAPRSSGRSTRSDRMRAEWQRQSAGTGHRGGARPRHASAKSPTRSRACSPATAPTSARSPASMARLRGRRGLRPDPATRSRPSPATEGRRPRMLVVKLGQDGHDRGAKVIATAFADLGFDVDIGPLFQTPEEAARQAVENDVPRDRRVHPGGRPQDPGAGAASRRSRRKAAAISWWCAAASSRPRTTPSCKRPASPRSTGPAPTSRWRPRKCCT